MINYQTILSSFDDKLTLMQWLNKVEDALKNGSLESVSLSQPTATTAILTFHFADGSSLESPTLVLPQGPQGPKGEDGKDGEDGTSVRILPNAESCTEFGDGYIDANGHLQVLNNLDPRSFEDAGLIRGPQGPAGQDGTDGTDGVSVTNVAVTQTNHLIVTLSNNTTIDAGEIQVGSQNDGFNIINASDITSNTLTQAQYDLITNGKPTLILGTLLNHPNMFIFSWFDATTTIRAIAVSGLSLFSILINVSTKVISDGGNDIAINKISRFNEKSCPPYPPDLTKDWVIQQAKTTGDIEWIDKASIGGTQLYMHRLQSSGAPINPIALFFISNSATPITSISELKDIIVSLVKDTSGYTSTWKSLTILNITFTYDNKIMFAGYNTSNEFEVQEFNGSDPFDDTVTAL